MIIYTKSIPSHSSYTLSTTPFLNYACTMSKEDFLVAHRVAHSHEFVELLFITSGTGTILIDDTKYTIKTGDMVLYANGVIHDETLDNFLVSAFCFGISNINISQLLGNSRGKFNPVIDCSDIFDFLNCSFHQIISFLQEDTPNAETICNQLFQAILSIIRSRLTLNSDINDTQKQKIYKCTRDYINSNYMTDLSVDQISRAVSVSPFHMSRIFKSNAGCSPMQYVMRLRLGKAQELLVHTDSSITDIATRVGYNSVSAFNYSFKKLLGLSPSTFRNLYR